MHPEIVRDGPGNCPICGMTLEPVLPTTQADEDGELRDMTRRFWVSAVLSGLVLLLAMGRMFPGNPLLVLIGPRARPLIELALATPVVLRRRSPNSKYFGATPSHAGGILSPVRVRTFSRGLRRRGQRSVYRASHFTSSR